MRWPQQTQSVMFIGAVPSFGISPTGSIALIMVSQREQHVASIWIIFAIGSHHLPCAPHRRVLLKIGEWSRRFFRQCREPRGVGKRRSWGTPSPAVPKSPKLRTGTPTTIKPNPCFKAGSFHANRSAPVWVKRTNVRSHADPSIRVRSRGQGRADQVLGVDGLLAGLVVAAMIWLLQFSASKECRGGAFSADFPVSRCGVVVRRLGNEVFRLPTRSSGSRCLSVGEEATCQQSH